MRRAVSILATLVLLTGTAAIAAPCKDAEAKFVMRGTPASAPMK